MGVPFKKIPTEDDEIRSLQENIAALAAAVPSPEPVTVTVTGNYQVLGTEDVIHVNAQAGPVKITLRAPSSTSRPLTIKQVNLQGAKTKVNLVTVQSADGSATIAGSPTLSLGQTGTGSVTLTADDKQHWPTTGSGGNPPTPAPSPSGQFVPYIGLLPIKIVGNVISFVATPPVPVITPWVAPVPLGGTGPFNTSSGNEDWLAECMVDFTGAPGGITAYWWFESQSAGGSATFGVRVGGSASRAIDGVLFAISTEPNTALTARSLAVSGPSPVGLQRVTLTGKSAGAGLAAKIGFVNLLFR